MTQEFIKPDYRAEAATLVSLITAAGDTEGSRKLLVHALGAAFATGGATAVDLVRDRIAPHLRGIAS